MSVAPVIANGAAGAVGVAATSGGPHPAAAWVDISVHRFLAIDPKIIDPLSVAFVDAVRAILRYGFEATQGSERAALATAEQNLMASPHDAIMLRANLLADAIVTFARGSSLAQDLAVRRNSIVGSIAEDLATIVMVERDWFAGSHGDRQSAQAYLALRRKQGAGLH